MQACKLKLLMARAWLLLWCLQGRGWRGENAYHLSGSRYLIIDGDMSVSAATPAGKVTTLMKESLLYLKKLREQVDIEKGRWRRDNPHQEKHLEVCIHAKNNAWVIAKVTRGKELYMVLDKGRFRNITAAEDMEWRRPPEGWCTLNSDGAVNEPRAIIGVGAVIQDNNGVEMGGLAKVYNGVMNPLTSEALTIREELKQSRKPGISRIMVASDSLKVVNFINSTENLSCIRSVIHDIRMMCRCFIGFVTLHVKRDLSTLGHSSAKLL